MADRAVLFPGEECLACNWTAWDDDPSEESLPTELNDRWAGVRLLEDLRAAALAKEETDAYAPRAKARGWPTHVERLTFHIRQASEILALDPDPSGDVGNLLALSEQHRAEREKFEDRCVAALQHHPDGAKLLKASYDTKRKCLDPALLTDAPAKARAMEAMVAAMSEWTRWTLLDRVQAEYGWDAPVS